MRRKTNVKKSEVASVDAIVAMVEAIDAETVWEEGDDEAAAGTGSEILAPTGAETTRLRKGKTVRRAGGATIRFAHGASPDAASVATNRFAEGAAAASQSRPWIGLDVDKDFFAAALYAEPRPGTPDRKAMPTKKFTRDAAGVAECVTWVEKALAQKRPGAGDPRVCMEATGMYSIELADEILRVRPEWAPAIANPRFVKKHGESMGQRCKSDKADARTCASYGAERQPPPYIPLSPAFRQLREQVRERRAVVEHRAALMNRSSNTADSKIVLKMQKQLRNQYNRIVEKLDAAIVRAFRDVPELAADAQAVTQIPGVAAVVSSVTLSELGDLRRYHCGRSVAAAVGVNPRVVESGAHQGKTRMSKQGNARVRSVLYCAAMASVKTKNDHCLKRFYNRLLARGKPRMQALGAVMRKIVVLMRALVVSGKTFDPDYDLKKHCPAGAHETVDNLV